MKGIDGKYHKLLLILIKPINYDSQGHPIRFFRGVLPSNTLSCLYSLSLDLTKQVQFSGLEIEVKTYDEMVNTLPSVRQVRRWHKRLGCRAMVCLVGVQSNQFPRAVDLALRYKAISQDLPVIIGGFHVSGVQAMFGPQRQIITPGLLDSIRAKVSVNEANRRCDAQLQPLQELMTKGVTLVYGEIEESGERKAWSKIINDALGDCLQSSYDFLEDLPDLTNVPVPIICQDTLKNYAFSNFATIDCGRGCIFACKFCTIINVQGRSMRCRSAEVIKAAIRNNWLKHKVNYYFFTDDNFCRNPNWEKILEAIMELQQEGLFLTFMLQVDTKAYRLKNFVSKAALAGCSQVFVGMESLNADNIKAAGKGQNKVEDYAQMVEAYHQAEIAVHVGFIIGFPYDSPKTIRRDLKVLTEVVKIDQVSFFMLTPLPGSQDHFEMVVRGDWMDQDLNNRDSFHPTILHPIMAGEDWCKLYQECWTTFYSVENFRQILQRWRNNARVYWSLLMIFVWYKNSAVIEGFHPMIGGFFRRKKRKDIRSGYLIEPRYYFWWLRSREIWQTLRLWRKLFLEVEELWLQTNNPEHNKAWVNVCLRHFWQLRQKKELVKQKYTQSRQYLNEYWPRLRQRFKDLEWWHPEVWFFSWWNTIRAIFLHLSLVRMLLEMRHRGKK